MDIVKFVGKGPVGLRVVNLELEIWWNPERLVSLLVVGKNGDLIPAWLDWT